MTGGDRYVGYLPQPGGERQNNQQHWNQTDGRLDAQQRQQLGFQRDGSFLSGRGESVSLGFQSGNGGIVTSFRITGPGGRLIESGINQDGDWQTQNGTYDDLKNVRVGRGANPNDSYLAFERNNGRTDVWKGSGRQFTVDGRMPLMESHIPGDNNMTQPVLRSAARDGSATDFHYSQIRDGRGFRSQLESYDKRDRDGNITEFAVRNSNTDGRNASWVTFRPHPGEHGLLSGMSREQQEETMRRAAAIARDPYTSEAPPSGLAGRAVRDPYKQVFSESVSRDGHLYQTSYNGERSCAGDDGKTYNWHANGMQSITATTADGRTRMLASDSGTLPGHGLVKDHYGYDASGRISSLTETSAQADQTGAPWQAQYRRTGNQWEVKQGDSWHPANVDIRNNSDGSVTIAQLQHAGPHNHENRAVSARTIFPDGGETISKLAPNGVLQPAEMLSATGEHSVLHYDQHGKLSSIDQSVRGYDGAPTTVHYQANPDHSGRWQKISENGARCEDIPAPTVGTGEVDFGGQERIDHRGDLSYAQRHATPRPDRYSDASDQNDPYDQGYNYRPHMHFRLPRFMLPAGTRPADFVDAPGHRMTRVGYEGYYEPVAPVPVQPMMPWQYSRYPAPQAIPYYSRRDRGINININI